MICKVKIATRLIERRFSLEDTIHEVTGASIAMQTVASLAKPSQSYKRYPIFGEV